MSRSGLPCVAPTEEIIEDIRQGRMVILVDDEDRENEGDLVLPADAITPSAVNFMARYGRGLICLAMPRDRVEKLGLPLMAQHNQSRLQTAFTTSIEAREGVTTGISAADRSRTIEVAVDPEAGPKDIVTPGHIFPLVARDGGVLVRAGHTEAAVDLARLAGRNPSGVICEILNEDGSMARLTDLIIFAAGHGLKVGTIADLIAYRRRTETVVERVLETDFVSRYGGSFRLCVYANRLSHTEHIALVKGDIRQGGPVLVRMHAHDLLDDVLADLAIGRGGDLQAAMEVISRQGQGVVVLLCEPNGTSLAERLRTRLEGQARPDAELRDYGIGAQILLDLGVREMTLLSNHRKTIIGLEGYGLKVTGHSPINSRFPAPPLTPNP